ncbi:hypothetical protein BDZ94DRAFT_1249591, partial [Collybia nuda]
VHQNAKARSHVRFVLKILCPGIRQKVCRSVRRREFVNLLQRDGYLEIRATYAHACPLVSK